MNPKTAQTSDDLLLRDCFRVLLPVSSDLGRQGWLLRLMESGTVTVLLGETREEYVARTMSRERLLSEARGDVRALVDALARSAEGPVAVAVDQEPWGICRLHGLVPAYPPAQLMAAMSQPDIEEATYEVARAAKDLGVSVFLAPVIDVLEGSNPWLEGRTWGAGGNGASVAAVAAAFVTGTQRAGVATVAKHFPGFPSVTADPALERDARVQSGAWSPEALVPFEAVARSGTAGIMVGPAVVEDVDASQPASTSRVVVDLLRERVGFGGLVVSDDLDAPATLLGRSLERCMIDALDAGAELLLVGGGDHLEDAVRTVHQACLADDDLASRVRSAAERVAVLARTYGTPPAVLSIDAGGR